MKTSYAERERYVNEGSCIAVELRELNPKVIVDVGACDGLDSVIYSRLFPAATIYAIEPRADNFAQIQDNIRFFSCSNIKPVRACLNASHTEVKFWPSSGDSGNKRNWETGNKSSSILRPTGHLEEHRWCCFGPTETIQSIRFDELSIPSVDYLHLDVQGAELLVLEGFGNVIDTLKAVWLEVAKKELYSGQPLIKDIEGYMAAHGFRKTKDTCHNKYGDQLWIR